MQKLRWLGWVLVFGLGMGAAAIAGQPAGALLDFAAGDLDYVPGEVLVRFNPNLDTDQVASFAADQGLNVQECIHTIQLCRMQITDSASVADTALRAGKDSRVLYSEPNHIDRVHGTAKRMTGSPDTPLAVPTDPMYAQQWHYSLINLPGAWNRAIGSASTVVAVVDGGVRFDHPDVGSRYSANGYDFISLDNNPTDPGGWSGEGHGTHTSGTIGAATNNGVGVAGITWTNPILPIRTLGSGGGTHFQFSQGFRYAAGLLVAPDPVNPTPAKIINYSGGGSHSATKRDAVAAVNTAGVVMVASSGNENTAIGYPAAYSPDYPMLICVGSTNYGNGTPTRASYSNFGPQMNVVGPGGDTASDTDADGHVDGVLSTTWDYSGSGTAVYEYWQGTSMAAPHVTGVAALMLGRGCPASRIRSILQSTATDLGTAGFDNDYGYGLINAKSALDAASPDLYISYLLGLGTISRLKLEDDFVVFKWRVKNKGCGISKPAVIKFWLSKDSHRGGGDIYLGSNSVRSLAGGASTARKQVKFALKKSVDPNRRWYICGRVDASKIVNEGYETNNEKSGRLTDR